MLILEARPLFINNASLKEIDLPLVSIKQKR